MVISKKEMPHEGWTGLVLLSLKLREIEAGMELLGAVVTVRSVRLFFGRLLRSWWKGVFSAFASRFVQAGPEYDLNLFLRD